MKGSYCEGYICLQERSSLRCISMFDIGEPVNVSIERPCGLAAFGWRPVSTLAYFDRSQSRGWPKAEWWAAGL